MTDTTSSLIGKLVAAGPEHFDSDHAREMIAIIRQHEVWQPIETAPKDGSYVLIFWNGRNIDVMCWLGKHGWQYPGTACAGISHPTHWMPLPTPPKDEVV